MSLGRGISGRHEVQTAYLPALPSSVDPGGGWRYPTDLPGRENGLLVKYTVLSIAYHSLEIWHALCYLARNEQLSEKEVQLSSK